MPVELPEDCVALLHLQRGVIARCQAEAAGLAPDFLRAKLRGGRWQPLYRGVHLRSAVAARRKMRWRREILVALA
jgi:hypothetical protein